MQASSKLLTTYLISLHLFIAVLIIKTDFLVKLKIKLGLPAPEISEHYLEMTQYHARIDQSLPRNAVLFIGDSHIQSLLTNFDGFVSVNFGIGNDTTTGVIKRISSYISLQSAKAVVLQIGINDLEYRSVSQTLAQCQQLLQQLPVNTPILLTAVFPVSETTIADGRHWNQEVAELNTGLKQHCDAIEQCQYLDLGNKLRDSHGDLAERYHIGDGVHLSNTANVIWRSAVYKALEQIK